MLLTTTRVLLVLCGFVAIRALVKAIRTRTREAANGAVRVGGGVSIVSFLLSLVGLTASFSDLGSAPATEKAAVLSQHIEDFVSPSVVVIGLGLLVAFVGGVLRGLAHEPTPRR